ncbi:hypothetical protein GCM10017778_53530 [Streptomyces vinaceus]|nr:hypothetical protein GCM10017778_53530 [Streptomyces vinaceus]
METVREVEHESGDDHDPEEKRYVLHLPRLLFDVSGSATVGNLDERKVNWLGRTGVLARHVIGTFIPILPLIRRYMHVNPG